MESLNEPPFEGVADYMALFHLGCPCGSASFHILGYPNDFVAGYLLCPLSVQCFMCERVIPMFDAKEHGYDGEYAPPSYAARGSGEPRRFECPRCSGVTFAAYVSFSYQFEDDEADELLAKHPNRTKDFFDWFILKVRCDHCGILNTAADYECA